ncbi:GntR family transcriptional regulator [Bradyrhizobium sp.]|uniref:GntR family transcriptional regulator n=1 Tax=Bradyrhizobium sp. TaxID=376 RepID=UPI002633E3F4|nr:GntR family transcriptional regulator [Bradyrhizobium sp.]
MTIRNPTRKRLAPEQPGTSSLLETAYEKIKRQITACEFRPGDHLNEAELSERLGIGRTPVHQAIDRLMMEGLVQVMPRKGILVTPVSLDVVVQTIEVRLLNECHCARLAAERASEKEIRILDDILARAEKVLPRRNSERLMRLDREFHGAIAQVSRNAVLADVLGRLHDKSLRFWILSLNTPGHHARVHAQHRAILDAIHAHDPLAAEQAMRDHIEDFRRNLLSSI